jgi:hypothetical protein
MYPGYRVGKFRIDLAVLVKSGSEWLPVMFIELKPPSAFNFLSRQTSK